MRIDAHHHLWHYTPEAFGWIEPASAIACDFNTDDLADEMAVAGIDCAIAVQARQSEAETAFLLDCAARQPRIAGVVGWIDLRAPDIADRIAARPTGPLLGYRHVVQDEPDADFLLASAFVGGVGAVLGAGLAYDVLVNATQLATLPAFLDRCGDGRLILDHAAKPNIAAGAWQPWAEQIAAAARHPNLFCKVSGLVTEAARDWQAADFDRYLDHVFTCFGPDRVLWGSDWPVCLLAGTYTDTRDIVARFVARHCPEAEAAVFGGNALRAYAMDIRTL
ncbi:amidohydrolase family protein [Sphingomonas sp. TDK1]|uniref:amidohydrolase family protein n=1 Tax=Sphingomonas sp. TDK1 TaxID=453247 RepID=UPI0007D9D2C8|nr:amidohydrolase family protein [Sphingomonas sp. TDK1]OAN66201.1 fuconolactone hydrolase [Sphingomonas sp. TDK1]